MFVGSITAYVAAFNTCHCMKNNKHSENKVNQDNAVVSKVFGFSGPRHGACANPRVQFKVSSSFMAQALSLAGY